MGTGAVSRYNHERSQEFVKAQRFYLGAAAGIRVERYEGHDIESREFKNRDKQMPFIVRVMFRPVMNCQSQRINVLLLRKLFLFYINNYMESLFITKFGYYRMINNIIGYC